MKILDWIQYNENVLRIDDVIIKVFRKKSLAQADIAIETKIKFCDMAQIFAEYTILFINFAKYELEITKTPRTTLCFGVYYESNV